MADYRYSANIIKRSAGQSSVASAAYRSASRLVDDRTGEIHDYTRKQGVIHSEVMPPEATPEWMHDRAQLWNTVEAVERRKDAQLSREIQLSLPHELDQEQRKAMLLDFVQEQFVDKGLIADVAIHAPSMKGDDRNHHAHVMLTMREITGEGFGNKFRSTPEEKKQELAQEREAWAKHQNRALERHGHTARVSHLSYEAQGIDREPSQHLGPVAADMERNGKASRIGDENRTIANDNTKRALDYAESARVAGEIARFEKLAGRLRDAAAKADRTADLSLAVRHEEQTQGLENGLGKTFGTSKVTIKAEVATIDKRLDSKGVRKILRSVFGYTRSDQETRAELTASLKQIEKFENEKRNDLRQEQEAERKALALDQQNNREQLEKGIEQNREKRERLDWMKTPSLEKKEALERPWQRATIRGSAEKRPWTRQASNDRERKPEPPKRER